MEFGDKQRKRKKSLEDNLLSNKKERRLLANVPDKTKMRTNRDRRGNEIFNAESVNVNDFIKQKKMGIRYNVDYSVKIICYKKDFGRVIFCCKGVDISTTGILLKIENSKYRLVMENAKKIRIKFNIEPGTMPEGYEMKVNCIVKPARYEDSPNGSFMVGMVFKKTLSEYANRKKGRYDIIIASLFLGGITAFIILMRAESVIYFKFNKWLYLYSIITAAFLLTRYFFSLFYRAVPIDPDYTPGVSILIPCFNEEEWIQRTILSCINKDYPVDKLEVIVIDDCSNDNSVKKVREIIDTLYQEGDQFETKCRLKYIVQHKNAGKRDALVLGTEAAKHDLIVFVDSDSFLDPFAIRNLVQPFKDPKMGGCAGRTDVANTFTNNLTKMQAVRYYIAFRIMKAAEGYFDAVSCLSGPLSCYRREIIMDNKDNWLNQKFLGQKATFGDDRSMTNFILKKHRTSYQDTAICSTIVPNRHRIFLKQQMRWKRSWLRESLIAGRFMWKKEPFAAISFYMGLVVPIAAPIVVLYNLIYVPLTQRIFPTTFLVGLLMMSLMMSMAQLLLRKSSIWLYGFFFCLYYEILLLWQMPVAWVTFWKSTWGTRMTPNDIIAKQKKKKLLGSDNELIISEIKEDGDNIPQIGFTLFTAGGSYYFENDKNLTPLSGMENINSERKFIHETKEEELKCKVQNEKDELVGRVISEPKETSKFTTASGNINSLTMEMMDKQIDLNVEKIQNKVIREITEDVCNKIMPEIIQMVKREIYEQLKKEFEPHEYQNQKKGE